MNREFIEAGQTFVRSCHDKIGAESCALFWIEQDDPSRLKLAASYTVRNQFDSPPKDFLIDSQPGKGLTAHLADLLYHRKWSEKFASFPQDYYTPVDIEAGAIRLTLSQLRRNPFSAGTFMLPLLDGTWSILAVALHDETGSFRGLVKLHNKCSGEERQDFTSADVVIVKQVSDDFLSGIHHLKEDLPLPIFQAMLSSILLSSDWPTTNGKFDVRESLLRTVNSLLKLGLRSIVATYCRLDLASEINIHFPPVPPGDEQKVLATIGVVGLPGQYEPILEELMASARQSNRIQVQDPAPGAVSLRFMAVPISSRQGDPNNDGKVVVFGVIGFISENRIPFTKQELAAVEAHAEFASTVILKVRSNRIMATAIDLTLNGEKECTDVLLQQVVENACSLTGYEHALLYFPDFTHRVLFVRASFGLEGAIGFRYGFEEIAVSMASWLENKRKFVDDVERPNNGVHRDGSKRFNIKNSLVALPLQSSIAPAEPWGVIVFWSTNPMLAPTEKNLDRDSSIVRLLADSISAYFLSEQQRSRRQAVERLLGYFKTDKAPELIGHFMEAIKLAGYERVRYFEYDKAKEAFMPRLCLGMQNPVGFKEEEPFYKIKNPYARDTIQTASMPAWRQLHILYDPINLIGSSSSPMNDTNPPRNLGKDPDSGRLEKEDLPWVVLPIVVDGKLIGQFTADVGGTRRMIPLSTRPFLDLLVRLASILLVKKAPHQQIELPFVQNGLNAIRAPLQSMFSAIELLRGTPAGDDHNLRQLVDKLNPILEMGVTRIERYLEVTDQLLRFRKDRAITANGSQSLQQSVLRVSARLAPKALARNIEIVTPELSTSNFLLNVSQEDLDVLIDNLLNNALKYSSSGHRVTISMAIYNFKCILSVADEGPGVPETQRNLITDAFVSIPRKLAMLPHLEEAAVAGTGLGLYLALEICLKYEAELECSAGTDGLGTTLTVRFPTELVINVN